MKYLDTKKGSLEEAVQQSMSGVVAKDLIEAGGKYLKYSDLLLQKGRLMAKNKSTAMIDKEISKEMKKLGIKESKDEYERFFNSALKKFKIDSPADLKTDAKKKEFFNYVDKNYKAKAEEVESNLQEKERTYTVVHIKKGKEIIKTSKGTYDAAKKYAKMKGLKSTAGVDVHLMEELDKEDTPTVKKVVKMLKKASNAHADQAKTLSKDLQDETDKNVDETLDAIREANVAKQKSMREILADIWNMNEGKNPFELEEKSPFDFKRQLKDPKKETMVMMKKGNYKGKVFVIDKKDLPKFERQGGVQVENKEIKEAPMKNYKYDPNFFVNDKKDTLQKLLRDRRSGYGETDLANYLAQKTGKDPEDVYFDDDELVYGSKTVMRGAHKQPIAKLMAKLKTIRNEYEPDMEEGFASDAQRRAAFAQGYKAKGKKGKKEEIEKDGKTATGQKPTKVEIEPEVK